MPESSVTLHLRHYRQQQGWALWQLAARVGKSRSALGRIERGETALTIPLLLRLADALQVPPWQLVEYPAWPVPTPYPCHPEREDSSPTP